MRNIKPEYWNGVPIPYEAPVASLRDVVATPCPNAWAAICALAYKDEQEAILLLAELANSPDWRYRRSAIEAIGIHPSGRTMSEMVCKLLYDPVAYVIRSALEAAASLGLEVTHDRIFSLLSSKEAAMRVTALRALEELWQFGDFEKVFKLYLKDPSDEVRKQAAYTIYMNANKDIWQEIFTVWSSDPLPRHRVWACELAGRFGNKDVLDIMVNMQNDLDGHVRKAAGRTVAHLETIR